MRVFTIVLVLVLAVCRQSREVSTPPATTIAVGDQPVDVAAADLDGDGALDLVSVDARGRTLSIRLQRGGRWSAPPGEPLAVDVEPHLVAAGDLDADGDVDLVATGHDTGAVYAWINDGKGELRRAPGSPFVAFAVTKPHNHGLAVGDLDGDGDADVVAVDQEARAAAVLLADGRGGLGPAVTIALAAQAYPIALGDLDGDGRLDLVVPLVGGQAIEVLRGDGRGGFAAAPGSPHRTVLARPYGIALCDLDVDGRLDVIAAHDDTDRVSVLRGDGRGGLAAAPGSPVAFGDRIGRPACADLDGDGALDVVGAAGGRLVILRGDGHGGLGDRRTETIAEAWRVLAADLDRDGAVDLVVPDGDADALRLWMGRAARR